MNKSNKRIFLPLLISIYRVYLSFTHVIARITKKYYFEDYFRVYPKGISYNPLGIKKKPTKADINNFLNHSKFYYFAAQFVKGKTVVDIGCGSGYGCEILKKAGAKKVYGSDISDHAIEFAKSNYKKVADFSVQTITDLHEYADKQFDVSISSEVLEHIKEYGKEVDAIKEIKRITRKNGLIVIGTPNNEILEEHGFSFADMHALLKSNFSKFCIFENSIFPPKDRRHLWEERVAKKKTGVIVSEDIDILESAIPEDIEVILKKGIKPGKYKFGPYNVNTKLLHNPISWVILAINN